MNAILPCPSVLLLGPTGAGKTPLGVYLERHGLWGAPCVHFDFGANLREAVARNQANSVLSREEVVLLRELLDTGALLEDQHIGIARRLVRSFLETRGVECGTWLVLNGLPRHVGQARALETVLDVSVVVNLDCTEQAVFERIRDNVGGDRVGRVDDAADAVAKRLDVFRHRTAPVLAYYGARTARILQVAVAVETTPEQIWHTIERCVPSVPLRTQKRGGRLLHRPGGDRLSSALSG